MSRGNLHTHTVFCDGKDTPEELVKTAIAKGCDLIGFSGHSFTDIPDEDPFCMTRENTLLYRAEIQRLKEVYRGKIRILLGIEQDYDSEESTDGYDFVIGSVHYVRKDGVYLPVDGSKDEVIRNVGKYYGGDFYAFAEDYFQSVGDVYRKTKCDIVGHFDLISKFNEDHDLFDPEHPRYRAAADAALERLIDTPAAFEVNYGAVARGYRTAPYPEERILKKLRAANKKILYTSDCHDRSLLLFGIPEDARTDW